MFKDPYYNYGKLSKPKISNKNYFDPKIIIDQNKQKNI